jgi:4-oxalocrotonate tautomerase
MPKPFFRLHPKSMPYVNVRITKDGVTAAQKAQIISEITATLQHVLNKKPEHTHIIIDEVEPDNWGYAGLTTTEFRKQVQTEAKHASENVAGDKSFEVASITATHG